MNETPQFKTVLNGWHRDHGAKMAPFAGWDMPIQYTGIIQEHLHCREKASVFDICHMGEILVSGPNAVADLSRALSVNVGSIKHNRCKYGFMLNEKGGVIDDLMTYRFDDTSFMLVVNAGCRFIDVETLRARMPKSTITDISDETGKIDLQGPKANEVLKDVLPGDWTKLPFFAFAQGTYEGEKILISRTGYTGELGYEIYVPTGKVVAVWEKLMKHPLVEAAGLGARDTLRLEAGLPLNGQDLDGDHTPVEAGYGGMITSEDEYVGKAAIATVRQKLIPMKLAGRRSARHGQKVFSNGKEVGVVTSASFAPSLNYAIVLAYINAANADEIRYSIQADRGELEAEVTTLPFYTHGTSRIKLA